MLPSYAEDLNVAILINTAPCSWYVNRRFERKYKFNSQVRNEAKKKLAFSRWLETLMLVCCLADFLPWKWKRRFPPKLPFTYKLHGDILQNMTSFVSTAVRNSNFICPGFLLWHGGRPRPFHRHTYNVWHSPNSLQSSTYKWLRRVLVTVL